MWIALTAGDKSHRIRTNSRLLVDGKSEEKENHTHTHASCTNIPKKCNNRHANWITSMDEIFGNFILKRRLLGIPFMANDSEIPIEFTGILYKLSSKLLTILTELRWLQPEFLNRSYFIGSSKRAIFSARILVFIASFRSYPRDPSAEINRFHFLEHKSTSMYSTLWLLVARSKAPEWTWDTFNLHIQFSLERQSID